MAADQQTLKDLEFDTIRTWLSEYAIGETALQYILELKPTHRVDDISFELDRTKELLEIRTEGERFPAIDFEELKHEIKFLPIKDSSLELEGFMRIHRASVLVNELLVFFDKREEEYPLLSSTLNSVYYTKEIIELIETVFDKHGKVKDDASELLEEIRQNMKNLRKKINVNFDREVRKLLRDNILGDTKETYINDRRVLSVLSSHKRKVPGTVVGSSNTGSFTYIELQVNIELNNELELLMDDERKEIFRILKQLKNELLKHLELIQGYQVVLTEFDFVNAKTRLALKINGIRPSLEEELNIELIDAFHPILWWNNNELKKKTYPQRITMDKFSRMLVISGPNAGGKSITLKTVGLLQVMLQSGLLIPAHENSKMCVFGHILSDIGDNQSIENELSTYSYRLKRMKQFLDTANRKTLLLIDEFGTGSDPDLGGALAEAIFEALYNKKSYGVITTHYSNIKLKADQLKNARNGSMLFNTETLEPLYKFSPGQPGSSFTFEVATINGIPTKIIESAKEKLDEKRVQMDVLLHELQKEKSYLSRLNKEHIEAQEIAQEALNRYEELSDEYEGKLQDFRDNKVANERLVQLGKKLKSFIDRYNIRSRKKNINDPLLEDVRKYLAVERSKIEEAKKVVKAKKASKKKPAKKAKPQQDQYHREKIKVGSKVKLIATRQAGVVEEMSGDNLTVTFGFVRMKVNKDRLMWVE